MRYDIERANVNDYNFLVSCIKDGVNDGHFELSPNAEAFFAGLKSWLKTNDGAHPIYIVIYKYDNRPIGFVLFRQMPPICELLFVYLDKKYRGSGVGTKMVTEIFVSLPEKLRERMIARVHCQSENMIGILKFNAMNVIGVTDSKTTFMASSHFPPKLVKQMASIFPAQ